MVVLMLKMQCTFLAYNPSSEDRTDLACKEGVENFCKILNYL